MDSLRHVFSRFPGTAYGFLLAAATLSSAAQPRLLIFSGQPEGVYHHEAIAWGVQLMKTLAPKAGFTYDTSTNPGVFTDANLEKYDAVLMNCNCRGARLFDAPKREAIQKFVRSGKGWAGSHCAAAIDLDLNWDWYLNLFGAVHRHHTDGSQPGILRIDDKNHPATAHFTSPTWNISNEELYFFMNDPAPGWRPDSKLAKVKVLITFQSWGNGQTLPPAGNKRDSSSLGAMSWYHEYDGGRFWYTGLGHENWLFLDSLYIKHMMGGLRYVLGMEGPTGIRGATLAPMASNARGRSVFIGGVDVGNPDDSFHSSDGLHGYRVFDILGNRVPVRAERPLCRYGPYRLDVFVRD